MIYTSGQVESVLYEIGIEVVSETDTNLLCLCPYHRNTDTPAFSIDKVTGAFMCFAPHCGETGNLLKVVQDKRSCNIFVARRLIERKRGAEPPLSQMLDDIFSQSDELPSFDQGTLNDLFDGIWDSPGHKYMASRGFTDETLAYFQVGYSSKKNMVTIPMHDWDNNPVGLVGRSVEDKVFKNSKGLPTRRVLFNTHRAKTHPGPVIIVESSMDAMKVYQAGFPCVVATNGSIFSDYHVQTINRYWNEAIIMTDFDNYLDHKDVRCKKCTKTCIGHNPGRALGEKMIKAMPGKIMKWATYDYGVVYPHGAKDAGDLTEEEIRQCITNAVSDIEYVFWKQEFELLSIV